MFKNLRKRQKIILLIALIIVFYFMIHPEFEGFVMRREWIWRIWDYSLIHYLDIIMNISIVAVATGIALFIESLIYSKYKDRSK